MIVANAQAEPIANLANHEANRNRGHESRFGGDGAIKAPWPDVEIKIMKEASKVSKAARKGNGSTPANWYNQQQQKLD